VAVAVAVEELQLQVCRELAVQVLLFFVTHPYTQSQQVQV
jgi:hypothetical protein